MCAATARCSSSAEQTSSRIVDRGGSLSSDDTVFTCGDRCMYLIAHELALPACLLSHQWIDMPLTSIGNLYLGKKHVSYQLFVFQTKSFS